MPAAGAAKRAIAAPPATSSRSIGSGSDTGRLAALGRLVTGAGVVGVTPDGGGLALHCPCHNGWFDLESGRPTAGPPRRPLPRVTVEVRGGTVYATGVEGGAV